MNRVSAHPRADPAGRGGRRGRRPLLRRALLRLVLAGGMAFAVPAGAQQGSGPLYGPVQPADTLWVLALRFRGEADVTPQQAMIAILRANPDAFAEGNVNALRTGVNLRVPSATEMAAITPGEAAAEFARHDEAWQNRRRTGSAAPAPAPGTPPAARPAAAPAATAAVPPPAVSPPAGTAEGEAGDAPDALAEARAEVAELRERLAERDTEIENLLVQLFAARRELDRFREAGAELPGESGSEAGADAEDPAEAQGGPPARQLPVSPLVLGSALIVLLVLVVVVTLIRRRETPDPSRGEEDDLYGDEHEDDDEEKEEEYPGEEDDEGGRGEEGEERYPDGGEEEEVRAYGEAREARGEEGREQPDGGEEPGAAGGDGAPPLRRMRSWRLAPAAATGAAAGAAEASPAPEAALPAAEHEEVDLPFGLDLDEGGEHGETAPAGTFRGGAELPNPDADPGFDRHVEVGELDDLDLGADPDRTSFRGLPDGPGGKDRRGPREASFSELPDDAGDEDTRGPGTAGLSDLSELPGEAEDEGEGEGGANRPGRPAGGRRRGTPAFGARE